MKRKLIAIFLAVIVMLPCFPFITFSAGNDGAINVYWDKERQTIDGFGASFSFRQSENVLNHFPEEKQDELLDLMFDREDGIGLSIIRNMVGDDMRIGEYSWGPPNNYGIWWDGPVPTYKTAATHTTIPSTTDPETGKSNLDGDNYRWFYDVDEYPGDYPDYYAGCETNEVFNEWGWDKSPMDRGQVWVMKRAEAYNEKNGDVIKNISSIWSPPAWLKSNNATTGRGSVPADQYQQFAEYMADYIEGYKKYYDIDIYGLSMSNEPSYNGGYSCAQWTNAQLRDGIKVIGPEFEKRGITAKLQGTEHMNWNETRITDTLDDPDAVKYLDTAIWHPYGSNETTGFQVMPNTKRLGLPIWETEWCTLDNETDNIQTALKHARLMNRQLTIAEVSAFCYWAGWAYWRGSPDELIAAGMEHDPNNGSGGLIYIQKLDNKFTGNYYIFKRYYVFGQYSKFIRPDWVRIENEQPAVSDLQTSAYKDPESGEFAIVVVNSNNSARSFDLNLLGADTSSVTAWRTSDTENLENIGDIALVNGGATVDIPAQSITTFVGKATEADYTIDAYKAIEGKLFDSIDGAYLNNNAALSDGVFQAYSTANTAPEANATYNNVVFGERYNPVETLNVRLANTSGTTGDITATVEAYLDSVSPENLLATQNVNLPRANVNTATYVNAEIPVNKSINGTHDVIIAVKSATTNKMISVNSFVFTGEADPELKVSTDAHLVKNGDYFRVNAFFDKEVKSNTAVLNYEFDTSKFSYRDYYPAEGVGKVSAEATDTGAKIVVMIPDYKTRDYGEVLLSAKEDVDLENKDNAIGVKVDYVVLNDDGEKEVRQASAGTSFTSTIPPPPDGYTLIDLSNLIDVFGMTKDHADWAKYRFFDFNNNGEIDIQDISTLASTIK